MNTLEYLFVDGAMEVWSFLALVTVLGMMDRCCGYGGGGLSE